MLTAYLAKKLTFARAGPTLGPSRLELIGVRHREDSGQAVFGRLGAPLGRTDTVAGRNVPLAQPVALFVYWLMP
jgi:hypothetical protein